MNKTEFLHMKANRKSFLLGFLRGTMLFVLGNIVLLYGVYQLNQYVIDKFPEMIAMRYITVIVPFVIYYVVFGIVYGKRISQATKKDTEYYLISRSYLAKTKDTSVLEYTLGVNARALDNNYEEIHDRVFSQGRQYRKTGKKSCFFIVLEYKEFDLSAFEQLTLDITDKFTSKERCNFLIVTKESTEDIRDFLNYEINTRDLQYHFTLLDLKLGEFSYKIPHHNNQRNKLAKNFKYMYKIQFNSSKRELKREHKEDTR